MPVSLPRSLCCAAVAGVAVAAAAAPRPDPLDAQASVPAVAYRSPLAGYRMLADSPPLGWREANDTVRAIGGWRSYLREAQQPDTAAARPGAVAPAGGTGHAGHQGPQGHQGHQGHHGHPAPEGQPHHQGTRGPAQPEATR